jgi:hypothetical protein
MKTLLGSLIAALMLALALALPAVAAPPESRGGCPKGAPADHSPPRSATGQANACGPRQ